MASKSYTGSCHCGENAFSVDMSPPLTDPSTKVVDCNCSICARNGYLLAFVPVTSVTWTKGALENLTSYSFGKKAFEHRFCPTCGTSLACKGGDTLAINIRAFDDVDLGKVNLMPYDGKSL